MCLGVSFTLEQGSQKSGGGMPPSLKSGGATGPPPRSAVYGSTRSQKATRPPFQHFSVTQDPILT